VVQSEVGPRPADDPLAGLSPDRRELFEMRIARWRTDLRDGLSAVYGDAAGDLERRVLEVAAMHHGQRDPELHRLDLERTLEPEWFQQPAVIGYAAYADRFAGALPQVAGQVPYLRELGVTYLHLMPLLQPRAGDNDGGYAVADYRTVRPDLGTMDDLRALAGTLRRSRISLVLDLVLNHVAREHTWAAAARAGDPRYRAYFHVFPDRTLPDAYERSLPEVFPDFAPGNFTWDDDLSGWVWTTFNAFQWDLNWANPDVFVEFADLVLFLANVGVEVLRLDAIAFLWKRMGTVCQNQPEVHAITQALRALLRIAAPATVLKAEAIVAPDDLVHYLGRGRHHGKVSDLAYHNVLMVHIWSMLATKDVRLAAHSLQRMPVIPTNTAWITYVRCHDDIGWAIDDRDAGTLGLSGAAHLSCLSDFYTGQFPGTFGHGLVFQENPLTADRRVSGMAAALTGLTDAEARGDADGVDAAIARILLAYAIAFGWGGIPVIWMGDEIGLPDDPEWASEPGHDTDNRWSHRPRMDAARQDMRHIDDTVANRLFTGMRHLAQVRAALPHLHASISRRVLDPIEPGVLAVLHCHPEGDLLQLYNVTDRHRTEPAGRLVELGWTSAHDALSDVDLPVADVPLAPYQARWLLGG
jgi:amylosucrase